MPRNRRQGKKSVAKAVSQTSRVELNRDATSIKTAEAIIALTGDSASAVEIFPRLHDVMDQLIAEQKDASVIEKMAKAPASRATAAQTLISWLSEREVDCSAVAVADFGPQQGFGLKAQRSISKHDIILKIAREFIMTAGDAYKSEIGEFLRGDPVCSAMESVALAMFVLHEKFKGDESQWSAYLDALPSSYGGCLYFSKEDFQLLKGSPTQGKIATDFRRLCRQYAIYVMQLSRSKEANCLAFRSQFTWQDFRWALATVMSRNNPIPNGTVGCHLGLVPLWDMANHKFGEMTTDYDLDQGQLVFHAMEDFKVDDQIVFHYGNRSNADLLTYCGFAVEDNPFDRFPVQLGVSSGDTRRKAFLTKLGLDNQESFFLSRSEDGIPEPFVGFARIFVMEEDDLSALEASSVVELLFRPLSVSTGSDDIHPVLRKDKAAAEFLSLRFRILMKVLERNVVCSDSLHVASIVLTLQGESSLLKRAMLLLDAV